MSTWCWFADSSSSLAEDPSPGPPERPHDSHRPLGQKRFHETAKNVNYCLSSTTDKNDKSISWVNKGYFHLIENVISFHKQLPLAMWHTRHLLFSVQLSTLFSFPTKIRFLTGRRDARIIKSSFSYCFLKQLFVKSGYLIFFVTWEEILSPFLKVTVSIYRETQRPN